MTKILNIAMTVFLILSISSVAIAAETMGDFQGKVIAVNNYAKTLTVNTIQPSISPSESGFTFRTDEATNVVMCNRQKDFSDVKVGAEVDLKYHEKDGKYVAEAINIRTPLIACMLE